jgi:succinyl-CoA synthetase beta subunit
MKIHEYQAQGLLKAYGLPVPRCRIAVTPEAALEAAREFSPCVIKAQVHTGGRGKAGGVKLAKTPEEAYQHAKSILGMTLVTKQTGPEGKRVKKVLVSEAVSYRKEFYLSLTTDNEKAGLVIIASQEGGTEIEETAKDHPERIVQIPVSIIDGYQSEDGHQAAKALGLSGDHLQELDLILQGMTRLYVDKDCTLIEINPLVMTSEGHLLCLDAKVTFDDNAYSAIPTRAPSKTSTKRTPMNTKPAKTPQLRDFGREHRLFGQWGGSSHGYHGHHQAFRRATGQFPRRRGQCHRRKGQNRV